MWDSGAAHLSSKLFTGTRVVIMHSRHRQHADHTGTRVVIIHSRHRQLADHNLIMLTLFHDHSDIFGFMHS